MAEGCQTGLSLHPPLGQQSSTPLWRSSSAVRHAHRLACKLLVVSAATEVNAKHLQAPAAMDHACPSGMGAPRAGAWCTLLPPPQQRAPTAAQVRSPQLHCSTRTEQRLVDQPVLSSAVWSQQAEHSTVSGVKGGIGLPCIEPCRMSQLQLQQ